MIGSDLKAWRQRLGLSQPRAAELLKTPVATYRGWEQDRRSIPGVVAAAVECIEQAEKQCTAVQMNHESGT